MAARIGWALTFIVVAGLLFWLLRPVLALLAAAAGLAYLLDPVVDWFENRGLSRDLGIVSLLIGVLVVVALGVVVLIPAISNEVDVLTQRLGPLKDEMAGWFSEGAAWYEAHTGHHIPLNLEELKQYWDNSLITSHMTQIRTALSQGARALFTQGLGLINAVVNLALLPIFTFYLLRDWDKLVAAVHDLVPLRYRSRVERVAREVDTRLGAFVRGQLTVCLALAVLYGTGLWLVGIDLAFTVGFLAGLLFIIPYFGTLVGIVLALLLSLIKFGIDMHLVWVLVVFGVCQSIEGWVLTPYIVGDKVGLHPMVVMVALIVGASVLGIWGMMLAIPVTAVLTVLGQEWLQDYKASTVYQSPPNERG